MKNPEYFLTRMSDFLISPTVLNEVFSAEEEIQKIRKEPRQHRSRMVRQFKEKLFLQTHGIIKLQAYLLSFIRIYPDAAFEILWMIVEGFSSCYGFSQKQKEKIRLILEAYIKKHAAIKIVRGIYKDDRELYKAVFGKFPEGEIGVVEGPISLYFIMNNINDFAYIYCGIFVDNYIVSREGMEKAKKAVGVQIQTSLIEELQGLITAENASGRESLSCTKDIFDHEEQHVIFGLFESCLKTASNIIKRNNDDVKHLIDKGLKYSSVGETLQMYRCWRFYEEEKMRNEILAYFKDGDLLPKRIYDILIKKGGLYDFFGGERKSIELGIKESKKLLQEKPNEAETYLRLVNLYLRKKVCTVEFYRLIEDGIKAFLILEDFGYSCNEVIAILIHEPLSRWKKVVKRHIEATGRVDEYLKPLFDFFDVSVSWD